MNSHSESRHPFEEFASAITLLTDVVRDLTRIENEKAEAAAKNRHSAMDSFIRREQVQLLKLRGLEHRRVLLAKELGWQDLTFRQILTVASTGQSEVLSPLFTELEDHLKNLTDSRQSADRIIRIRLKELDAALAAAKGADPGGVQPPHIHDRYV